MEIDAPPHPNLRPVEKTRRDATLTAFRIERTPGDCRLHVPSESAQPGELVRVCSLRLLSCPLSERVSLAYNVDQASIQRETVSERRPISSHSARLTTLHRLRLPTLYTGSRKIGARVASHSVRFA